jgi:thioredoxin 1
MVILKWIFIIGLIFAGCSNPAQEQATQKELITYDKIVAKIGQEPLVLEIGASSCQSCKAMKATIDRLLCNNPNLPIHVVDVNDNREAIERFKIQIIPTQVAYNAQGEEIFRHIGTLSEDQLLELIKNVQKER